MQPLCTLASAFVLAGLARTSSGQALPSSIFNAANCSECVLPGFKWCAAPDSGGSDLCFFDAGVCTDFTDLENHTQSATDVECGFPAFTSDIAVCATCLEAGFKFCQGNSSLGQDDVCYFDSNPAVSTSCSDYSQLENLTEIASRAACGGLPEVEDTIPGATCAACVAAECKFCDGESFFDEVDVCYCGDEGCSDFPDLFFADELTTASQCPSPSRSPSPSPSFAMTRVPGVISCVAFLAALF